MYQVNDSSRPRRNWAVAALVLVLSAAPAMGVINGEVDTENRHPNVGCFVIVSRNGEPIEPFVFGSCTLIAPRVVLTAGHINLEAEQVFAAGLGVPTDARVSFGTDPFEPSTWHQVTDIVTHPSFTFDHGYGGNGEDVGVAILKEPVVGIEPATLPPVGYLDDLVGGGELRKGGNDAQVTVVGYGDGLLFPPPSEPGLEPLRRFARAAIASVSDKWLSVLQSPGGDGGGINFGDSGGAAFLADPDDGQLVLVGVPSWVGNASVGTGHLARIDRPEVLEFIDLVFDAVGD